MSKRDNSLEEASRSELIYRANNAILDLSLSSDRLRNLGGDSNAALACVLDYICSILEQGEEEDWDE